MRCLTNGERVPDCSHDRKEQNWPDILKQGPIGHEVAGIEDDRREEVDEEGMTVQRKVHSRAGLSDDTTDDETNWDQ